MPIAIQQIRDIVNAIFSDSGYSIKNFNVSFPEPLDIKIVRERDSSISLSFTGSMPKVGWKKVIRLTAWIEGITLGPTEGTLRLKYLPDIKFSYDTENETMFGFGSFLNTYDIAQEIESEFSDCEEKKKVANKCLHYASEWATIASQSGVNFGDCNEKSKRKLKKECKSFVIDNLKNDPEIVAGSIILGFLFFYVVLPVILKFVLERLFKRLFS